MERNITSAKFIIIVISICLLTFVLQHFAIYKLLIVPQLSGIKSVPLLWWGGYILPIFVVLVLVGFWSKNVKEIFITSLFVSVLYNLFVYFLAKFNEPGYLKAYEGSFALNFIEGCLIFIIVFFILLLIGYVGNRLLSTTRHKEG